MVLGNSETEDGEIMSEDRNWNAQQVAVREDVANGKGHTVVVARAGTGKTTTIVGALGKVPRGNRTLMVAFNKKIATELSSRVPRGVDVSTCHSFGLKTITKALGRVPIDEDKTYKAFRAMYGRSGGAFPFELCRVVCKLVSLAKGSLASEAISLDSLIDDFGLLDKEGDDVKRGDVVADALTLLARAQTDLTTLDFDDMIWLPHVLALNPPTYDRVFIDETQDLNPAQVELALKACTRFDGRILAVGDDRQAIYRFRGAGEDSVGDIVRRLEAKTLPLSITYRCPRAVVEMARRVVADFSCPDDAPEGIVREARREEAFRSASAGDFVLSRTNAPLIGGCLSLLKEGRRAIILGRDIGTNLAGIVDRSKATSTSELEAYLDEWVTNETARLSARQPPKESAIQVVIDKAECIRALAEGTSSPYQVKQKIEDLFTDARDGNSVVFSTTHKAKGLEADRVFMLADTYRKGMNVEEDNCWYVAVTRAKKELVMVRKEAA